MTIYNKQTIITLLGNISKGLIPYIIVDKHNAKNFCKVASKAKYNFIIQNHRNGSVTVHNDKYNLPTH